MQRPCSGRPGKSGRGFPNGRPAFREQARRRRIGRRPELNAAQIIKPADNCKRPGHERHQRRRHQQSDWGESPPSGTQLRAIFFLFAEFGRDGTEIQSIDNRSVRTGRADRVCS